MTCNRPRGFRFERGRLLLGFFLAAVFALTGFGASASAGTWSTTGNGVGAPGSTAAITVGPAAGVPAGQRLGDGLPQSQVVQGHGVHDFYVLAGTSGADGGAAVLVHNAGCGDALSRWVQKADFSDAKTLSKKYDAHAADFGIAGNRNSANLAAFRNAMKDHMTAAGTKIYRFDYRGQGQAIGFINPSTGRMVMLRADNGKFWTAYRLGDKQFAGIVDKGRL